MSMGFLAGFLFGIATAVVSETALCFLLPALKGPRDKFIARIRKREKIEEKARTDQHLLEEIEKLLSVIIRLPDFPDTSIKEIQDALAEIKDKAKQIEILRDIKERLIVYSKKVDKLHANISFKERLDLLLSDAIELKKEIKRLVCASC